uniref:C2H2-type domain-containing protein n=1 Tax=Plectus sambesii TaxID=2011161 RepID=A0A914VI24_9BILA
MSTLLQGTRLEQNMRCNGASLLQPRGNVAVRIGGMKTLTVILGSSVVKTKVEPTYEIRILSNNMTASSSNIRPLIVYEPPISYESPSVVPESGTQSMPNVRVQEVESEQCNLHNLQNSLVRQSIAGGKKPLIVFEGAATTSSSKVDDNSTSFGSEAAFFEDGLSNDPARLSTKPLDPELRFRSSLEHQYALNELFPSEAGERTVVHSIFCHECKTEIFDGQRHLYNTHVRLPLFRCPYCDYSAYVEEAVDEHLKDTHEETDLVAVSQVDAFSAEIKYWRLRCYATRSVNKMNSGGMSADNVRSIARGRECKLCKGVTTNPYSHVFVHLNVPNLFSCTVCGHSSFTQRQTVSAHCRKVHKQPAAFATREDEFAEEIRALKLQCFGIGTRQCAISPGDDGDVAGTLTDQRPPQALKRRKKLKIECRKCHRIVVRGQKRFHTINHHIPPSFKCASCGRLFQTRSNVQAHLRRVHGFDDAAMKTNLLTKKMPDLNALIEECFGPAPVPILDGGALEMTMETSSPETTPAELHGQSLSKIQREESPAQRQAPPLDPLDCSPKKSTAASQEPSASTSPVESNELLPSDEMIDSNSQSEPTKKEELALKTAMPKRPVGRPKKAKANTKMERLPRPTMATVAQEEWKDAVRVAGAEEDFECVKCSRVVAEPKRGMHMLNNHVPPGFFCPKCDTKFRQRANGELHLRKHHQLGREHLQGRLLDRAELQVWVDKYFVACNGDVSTPSMSVPGLLPCGKCDRSFTSKSGLVHHRRRSHPLIFYEEH